ncbi:MAG: hypothetical protein K1X64_10035 [Myxococcaceae bacterium]|nr:hypothetical protein [Myxococcaceae bacterium]
MGPRRVAITEEIAQQGARLPADWPGDRVLRQLFQRSSQNVSLGEPQQAQYIETVFVLSAIVVVLALGDLVELRDKKRGDARDGYFEGPRIRRLESADSMKRVIDDGGLEPGRFSSNLIAVRAEPGASTP